MSSLEREMQFGEAQRASTIKSKKKQENKKTFHHQSPSTNKEAKRRTDSVESLERLGVFICVNLWFCFLSFGSFQFFLTIPPMYPQPAQTTSSL
jgi:hypothetical protein